MFWGEIKCCYCRCCNKSLRKQNLFHPTGEQAPCFFSLLFCEHNTTGNSIWSNHLRQHFIIKLFQGFLLKELGHITDIRKVNIIILKIRGLLLKFSTAAVKFVNSWGYVFSSACLCWLEKCFTRYAFTIRLVCDTNRIKVFKQNFRVSKIWPVRCIIFFSLSIKTNSLLKSLSKVFTIRCLLQRVPFHRWHH